MKYKNIFVAFFVFLLVPLAFLILSCKGKTKVTQSVEVNVGSAPVISSLLANPSTVAPGAQATCSVSATDNDGDTISYSWSGTCGEFQSSAGQSVAWSAPTSVKDCTVTVVVSDGKNTVSASATIKVQNLTDSTNKAPTISSITANPSFISTDSNTTVSASASDADGDVLSYSWSASGGATNGTSASVTYTAPPLAGTYAISVTVSDAKGGSASASVNVAVYFQGDKVSAGGYHTCALTASGGVKCWGYNEFAGQLGDGKTTNSSIPVDVSGLTSGVSAVSVGRVHTCVLTTSGGVKCWGYNAFGQLGDGTTTSSSTPVNVTGLTSGVVAIATGADHSCALTSAGAVKCWGYNFHCQVGNGTSGNTTPNPVNVSSVTGGVIAIAAGGHHTCALTTSGGVKCWGRNDFGQLGIGSTTGPQTSADGKACAKTPVDVSSLTSGVSAITVDGFQTCAMTSAGGVKCWGDNTHGQLGNGSTTNSSTPVDVSGLTSGVKAVSEGDGFTCAVLSSGAAKCWGNNNTGQLGVGTTVNSNTPASVSGLGSSVSAVSSGALHACALLSSGNIQCWGWNQYGQLGNGTTTDSTTPVSVVGFGG